MQDTDIVKPKFLDNQFNFPKGGDNGNGEGTDGFGG